MQAETVDEDGYVTVSQDHCSDYVLTKEKTDVTKKNDEETTVKSDNPKTGDAATAFPVIVLIGSAMTIAAGMGKVKRAE